MNLTTTKLIGTCHCGAIRITVPQAPAWLTCCNCSMCRRLGTLWAYYSPDSVVIAGHAENADEYIHGDRMLRLLRCKSCGCVTHWEPIAPEAEGRVGVNMRNFEPALLQDTQLKLVDGATSWTSVPAQDLVRSRRGVNRPWHRANPMARKASVEQRVAWHRAHALACACRRVPEPILKLIAERQGAA